MEVSAGAMSGALQPGWVAVLDAMERRLMVAERYLAGEAVHVEHFVLPDDLGPLPVELRPRARALLAATADAEERLAVEMESIALRIRKTAVVGRNAAGRPAPSYFDRSA